METVLSSERFDVIVHLAAIVHDSRATEQSCLEVNYHATMMLFSLAEKYSIKQFVFMSTAAVYGDSAGGVLDEESPTNPVTPYAISKLKAEEHLRRACESPVKSTVIRCTTVYGRYDRGNIDRLFRVARRRIVPIPGDGNNLKSLIYVENLVQGIVCTLLNPAAYNELFIFRDKESYSVNRIIRDMETTIGKRVWVLHLPVHGPLRMLNTVGRVCKAIPGMNTMQTTITKLGSEAALDNSKATRLLSFVPDYSLLEGLRRIYAT